MGNAQEAKVCLCLSEILWNEWFWNDGQRMMNEEGGLKNECEIKVDISYHSDFRFHSILADFLRPTTVILTIF